MILARICAGEVYATPAADAAMFLGRSDWASRLRRWAGLALSLLLFVLVVAVLFSATLALAFIPALIMLVIITAAMGAVAIVGTWQMMRSARGLGSTLALVTCSHDEPYWLIESLGRDPRSPVNALAFAAHVATEVIPADEILYVVAADERRVRVYERAGFNRIAPGSLTLVWRRPAAP